MKVTRTLAMTVAALGAAAVAYAQVALQYRWKQGEAVVYQTSLKTDSVMTGMPGMGDVTLGQSMSQRIKLLPAAVAPDGMATLQQTTEAIKVEMQTMMGRVAYDSTKPGGVNRDESSDALARVFGGMVGATISVIMLPNGAIQRIEGVQRVYDRIAQDLPAGRAGAQMAQTLKSVISEESIRAALAQSFPRLPLQPVKAGDTWTGQIALGSDVTGRIAGAQTLTLKRLDEAAGVAIIGVALSLTQESAPPFGPSGMTMKLGEGSKGQGEIEFDVARGRIRKATMTTEMPSTMTATGPDGRPATLKNVTKTSMMMEEIR